ncbi:aspartyl-tRNA synthetase 2, mitochondrial [Halocaridina rubra]|uniref:Aspartyl-tRNA synthetase 2, mitochondrial n=1 Tax=Halocaridina rubra TaxID=373956 RepID=A0AAN9A6F3_HALRR
MKSSVLPLFTKISKHIFLLKSIRNGSLSRIFHARQFSCRIICSRSSWIHQNSAGIYIHVSLPWHRATTTVASQRIGFTLKTHSCGELTSSHAGQSVVLRGFLQYQRMGRFAVLRDIMGKTQVLIREEDKELSVALEDTPFESYVEIRGVVHQRPEEQYNKDMTTGEIEVIADSYKVLSRVQRSLPFLIRNYNKPKENLRLQYRYLDLRHEELQRTLKLRSRVAKKMRDYLQDVEDFVEIATPTLSVNTPGGAQEFVVPSRHPGQFYSLVQSPQTYKQLAMIGGFEKYFQFAICYRDEGGKPDRQPEFMQVDLEMANVTMEEVQRLIENLLVYSWPSHLHPILTPFPVMTYDETLSEYGTDKPDVRFEWKIKEVTDVLQDCGANTLETLVLQPGNSAHAFVIPEGQIVMKKKLLSTWEALAMREFNLNGLTTSLVKEDKKLRGNIARHLKLTSQQTLIEKLNASSGDIIVLAVGPTINVQKLLGKLRLLSASAMEEAGRRVRDPDVFNFLWVINFPLFEVDETTGKTISVHHPFTLPKNGDEHFLHIDPLKAKSQHFDLVLNGSEIGGGSIRVHDPVMQRFIMENILGIDSKSLGFFTEALESGAPPHGGIALGYDRLMEKICGGKSIRDVIAFPKSMAGRCLMSGAPGNITEDELNLYHIHVKKS